MAENNKTQDQADPSSEVQLQSGTYEVIRNRLTSHGAELRTRIDSLNAERKEVFGSIETTLLATARVTTDHNCVPRDSISIGNKFLFGYNVHIVLKTETTPEGTVRMHYRDLPARGQLFALTLPADAFPMDDVAHIVLPNRPPLRVAVAADLLEQFAPLIDADPALQLTSDR